MWIPDTHERLSAAVHEQRHRSVRLVTDHTQIVPKLVHRPGLHLSKSVRSRKPHRILHSRIIPDFDARIVPPIETMARVTAVAEHHPLLKDRKSTRLNSSHRCISYAVFCLKKKKL